MANPLKTEHAIDWSHTAQEIEDHYQSGMIERDRYRSALETIADPSTASMTHAGTVDTLRSHARIALRG